MSKRIFNQIAARRPRTNNFDLSHEKKLSMNMGDLIPILCEEVIPGDNFRVKTEVMLRLAPMLAPIMHRVNVQTHWFFVPNRLTWDNWEDFITGGPDGTLAPNVPRMEIAFETQFGKARVGDYFGIPPIAAGISPTNKPRVSALPFRAYQMIYNEYFRDQNLEEPIEFGTGDGIGSDIPNLTEIRRRNWEKDYFTSALPWPQRGGEVQMPIQAEWSPQYTNPNTMVGNDGFTPINDGPIVSRDEGTFGTATEDATLRNLADPQTADSAGITINELRRATRLQEWLEKNARGGARYVEQIFSHFGVKSSDARLQRPEFLGGGRSPIVISEVLSTAEVEIDLPGPDAQIPQGNMSGHGIGIGTHHGFKRRFEEHGYIIGIMSVLPKTTYQQGIPKTFLKTDKFDFFWPEFANIGEQPIIDQELYVDYQGTQGEDEGTFGYQSRYSEYKFKNSSVHGDFRDTLQYWHMGRFFEGKPELNELFVQSDPTTRIFAVDDSEEPFPTDKLYVQLYNNVRAIRPMPVFGTPTL